MRTIGEAKIGRLLEVIHIPTGQKLELKSIPKTLWEDSEENMSMFEADRHIASLFNHPNIARAYDFGESPDDLVVAMELCFGGTLVDMICGERFQGS